MLLSFLQAGCHQTFEVRKLIALQAIHQVNVVLCQLERCLFEGPLPWRILKHKAEVDVQDVSKARQHDIAVMPVFDIEDVAEHRVPSQRSNKVPLCFLKAGPIVPPVELTQRNQFVRLRVCEQLLLEAVDADRVGHKLNHRRVGRCYEDVVGVHPQAEACTLPDLLESDHQLDCKHFLAAIIVCFYYYRFQVVGFVVFVL